MDLPSTEGEARKGKSNYFIVMTGISEKIADKIERRMNFIFDLCSEFNFYCAESQIKYAEVELVDPNCPEYHRQSLMKCFWTIRGGQPRDARIQVLNSDGDWIEVPYSKDNVIKAMDNIMEMAEVTEEGCWVIGDECL